MGCTTLDLREKAVINVCNGQKLGYVAELEIDVECGNVTALIVKQESIMSLLFCKNLIRVPWDKIQRIGKDTILVDLPLLDTKSCDACESDFGKSSDVNCCDGKRKGKWWRL